MHSEAPTPAKAGGGTPGKGKPFYKKGKKTAVCGGGGAGAKTPGRDNVTARIKEEAFLVVSLAVSGRSSLNGWVLSIGAVAVTAATREVLGVFERNVLPIAVECNVEPTADVWGFWRRQRAELEYLNRRGTRHPVQEVMQDLKQFCEPYTNLTLVGAPLLSVYGWLSYYWSYVFPSRIGAPAPPGMPWGFSGLCARSYAAGCLGENMKRLPQCPAYVESFEGFKPVGIPIGDAIAAAVSFTHLYWKRQLAPTPSAPQVEGTSSEATATAEPAPIACPPPLTFRCTVDPLLFEIGCVPATVLQRQPELYVPRHTTAAGPAAEEGIATVPVRTLADVLLDRRIVDGLNENERILAASAKRGVVTVEGGVRPSDAAHNAETATGTTEQPSPAAGSSTVDTATAQPFTEYPSITDTVHQAQFLHQLPAWLTDDATEWVATEKVHGSNFTILTDGNTISAAKRTGLLTRADSPAFFEFVYLLEDAKDAILSAYELTTKWLRETVMQHGGDLSTLVSGAPVKVALICELAGGEYPHPHVPVDLRGTRVQTGVYYAPFNFLYGFDIAIESGAALAGYLPSPRHGLPEATSFAGADDRLYLPYDVMCGIFAESGFPSYAKPLQRGPLRELLHRPAEFPSTIATDQLQLPALTPFFANDAEGVVLRPTQQDVWVCTSHGDDRGGEWFRAILKYKHPRFQEFTHQTSLPSACSSAAAGGNSTTPQTATAARTATPIDLTLFLTEARVTSVLSKYTETEQSDHARMVAAVLADAMKDAQRYGK